MNKKDVISELRETDGEIFEYDGDIASIHAVLEGETHVEIGHFVVRKDERLNGYGSIVFESLLQVLREHNINSATVKIQALDDGSPEDPIMNFLSNYNFEYQGSFKHYNWDLCIKAHGYF